MSEQSEEESQQLQQKEEEQQNSQIIQQDDKTEQQLQQIPYVHMLNNKYNVREAVHAGSWYSSKSNELKIQINCWLEQAKAEVTTVAQLKALVVPHAGYAYSGPTAAFSYKYLKKYPPSEKLKVFILGPCHYVYITQCCLTRQEIYETPLGNIKVDLETVKQLHEQGQFEQSDKDAEEEEHSIEMQLPFLAHILGTDNFTIIPIMVGSIDAKSEEYYGKLLSEYFDMDDTLFIISTDFCHWGTKFAYTYFNNADGEIFESIEKLDQKAMEHIELHDLDKFNDYLREYENNICGKHCIAILLHCIAMSQNTHMMETKFIRYAQSCLVRDKKDSSVSYAAAITFLED
ncbi:unnamed protein product [Paramecium pentaurelia]|uniref:Uncharacterized protein n=1 Tax=Paramecium pentaurelia TaxID=43138 RepID=A0A8S1Y744_9CILI|nr:unnamed protein product [Paramecium pentaurelia]CAD8209621.1 unnamed protein product [Paramecium pentaurelia]